MFCGPRDRYLNDAGKVLGLTAVWREKWAEVSTLREESESHEVDVPVVVERTERRGAQ